jgi:Na+/H+-dicarboxylate symporter
VVLGAIVCGALLGYFWPAAGVALKPFGDGFIALIKMLIAPVIFLTVVLGIAGGAALLVVLGTSSSEVALPPLMLKLERLGCPRQVVGLVIPIGYSFNLDGTNIYLTMAALFVAQALKTIVIARWEGVLDRRRLDTELANST